jgi:hypothetical protein
MVFIGDNYNRVEVGNDVYTGQNRFEGETYYLNNMYLQNVGRRFSIGTSTNLLSFGIINNNGVIENQAEHLIFEGKAGKQLIINDSAIDWDVEIKGTSANLFRTDASADAIGIGKFPSLADFDIALSTRIGDATNGLAISATGDLTLEGSATVWEDLQFQISTARVPASNFPSWEAFTTNTYEYAFDVDEYVYLFANELYHSWKEGTAANVHLHITNKTAQNTGANRYAKFTVYIAYADTDEVWTETSVTAELTIPTGTSAMTNFYLDVGDLSLTNNLIGSQIKCTVYRIAATGGTEYADSTFITQVGMHLENDSMGSREEITK